MASAWILSGNSAQPTDFLGTTDNQPLVIKTAGEERLRIDTTGNVGIGTTQPQRRLQIGNDVVGVGFDSGNSPNAGVFRFGDNSGWKLHFGRSRDNINGPLNSETNGLLLTIQDNGNVGVGTANPSTRLDIANNGGGRPQDFMVRIHQESNTGVGTDSNALLRFSHFNGANGREWTIGTGSNSLFGHPDNFGINDAISGTALVINNIGNIGIGTASPSSRLDIANNGGGRPQDFMVRIHQESNTGAGTDSNALLRFSHFNGGNGREWTIGTGSNSLFGHPDNFGINDAISGTALVINNIGNVGIGTPTPSEKLSVNGNVTVSGDVFLTGADCAEHFDAVDSVVLSPGTVVVIDGEGTLKESDRAYDKRVAGVVSGAGDYRPGLILDRRSSEKDRIPVALAGKVYCRVDAQYAPIEIGDLLTSSLTPGYAMKADDPHKAFGAVIGKALSTYREGQGLIPILVALQ